jgi:tetratricopeptide (TPR) repeat protein
MSFLGQLYNNMGICFKNRNLKKKALLLFEESYRIKTNFYSKLHPSTFEVLMNIGILHDQLGFHTKAIMFYDEILNEIKYNTKINFGLLYSHCLQNKGTALYNLGLL